MYQLLIATDPQWTTVVLDDFDHFLIDHAACERKASGMAMSMVMHYPDKPKLISAMIDLSIEELAHFREVMKHIIARNLTILPDKKDPYVNQLRHHIRHGADVFFLDKLLTASIIEARGHERFHMIGQAIQPGPLQRFYQNLARAEEKHYELFIDLAYHYFDPKTVAQRLQSLLEIEANIITQLPHRPAVH